MQLPGCDAQNAGLLISKLHSDSRQFLYAPAHLRQSEAKRLVIGDPFELATRWNTTVEWKTIHILHRPKQGDPPGLRILSRLDAPFHIPRWHIIELFKHRAVVPRSYPTALDRDFPFPMYSNGVPSLYFHIKHPESPADRVRFRIKIHLGICHKADDGSSGHWAFAEDMAARGMDLTERPEHLCAQHHIDNWPRRTRVFMFNLNPPPGGQDLYPYSPDSNSGSDSGSGSGSDSSDESLQLQVELSFTSYSLVPEPTTSARRVHIKFNVLREPDVMQVRSKL